MRRRLRGALAVLGALCLLVAALRLSGPTLASWKNSEYGTGAFTGAAANPPRNLSCTTDGVSLGQVKFSWSAPTAVGSTHTGYSWTVTGASSSSGTVGKAVTTVTVSVSLLTLGTSTFRVRTTVTAGGAWNSTTTSGTIRAVSSVLVTCSVP